MAKNVKAVLQEKTTAEFTNNQRAGFFGHDSTVDCWRWIKADGSTQRVALTLDANYDSTHSIRRLHMVSAGYIEVGGVGGTKGRLVFTDAATDSIAVMTARLGVGITTPDSLVHIWNATAGSVTAPSGTLLTVENSTAAYITILAPDGQLKGIYMGDEGDNDRAAIYIDDNNKMVFKVAGAEAAHISNNSQKVGIGGDSQNDTLTGQLTVSSASNTQLQLCYTIDSVQALWTVDSSGYSDINTSGGRFLLSGGGGPAPDSLLHLWGATAGSVSCKANTLLTLENAGGVFVQFLGGNAELQGFYFGDAQNNMAAYFMYNHSSQNFIWRCDTTDQVIWTHNHYGFGDVGPASNAALLDVQNNSQENTAVVWFESGEAVGFPTVVIEQKDVDEPFVRFHGTSESLDLTYNLVNYEDTNGTPTPVGYAKVERKDNSGEGVYDGDYFIELVQLTLCGC